MIVGIDAESLHALNEWPWPRRHHARLLQMLRPAAPKALFVDIDFSSRSTEEDDALFERALADWQGTPVYLASHFQARSGADSSLIVTRPLQRFAAHAELASVMLEPGADGLVRDMRSSWADRRRDAAVDLRATRRRCPQGTVVPIDFSIDDGSFGYVSFIDVVNGRVDPAALRGKTVYVGPTAIELGDIVTVPVYRALPGVVVQAFATESVREGLLRALPAGFYAVGARRSGRCAAHCCSGGAAGGRTPRSSWPASACSRPPRCCSTARPRRARRRAVRARARRDFRRGHDSLARRADVARGRVRARRQAPRRAAAQRRRVLDRRHRLYRRARNDPHGESRDIADLRLRSCGVASTPTSPSSYRASPATSSSASRRLRDASRARGADRKRPQAAASRSR